MLKCPICLEPIVSKAGKTQKGKQRYFCVNRHRTANPISTEQHDEHHGPIDPKFVKKRIQQIIDKNRSSDVRRYVITSAQNNTMVHKQFFESLLTYCNHNNAELIVIPVRYKNPTSQLEWSNQDEWWPAEVRPYMIDRNLHLSRDLVVMSVVKIQATAVDPLSGLETISGTKSAIFGHGQIRMKTVPTPQDKIAKILHTTGSVSVKNYSQTKAGAKGKHHHSLGAVVVEISDKTFFMREICWPESGSSFQDLTTIYTPTGVIENRTIEALVTGDEHVVQISDSVLRATYLDEDSIVNVLRPKYIVRHDVLDFYCQNHHHRNNIFQQYAKHVNRINDVRRELDQTIKFIDETTPDWATSLIVSSNHVDFLTRWLKEYKPYNDPMNLRIYAELLLAMCQFIEEHPDQDIPDAFQLYASRKFKSNVVFLSRRKSFLIKGIDVSQHGDVGAGGARGTIRTYAKTEYKSIIGHSHAPGIQFGCYQVGTSSRLQLDYNIGLSSWMNTHCIIYPNGKRTLIHIMDGKWRA